MATDKTQSLKIHFPLTILTKAVTFCFFSIKELPAQQIKNGQYLRPKPLLNPQILVDHCLRGKGRRVSH